MEKIWLKEYPAGIPAEIDPDQCPRSRRWPSTACTAMPSAMPSCRWASRCTLRPDRAAVRRLRCVAAEPGVRQGRPHRHHAAEPAAVSGRHVRCLRAGLVVVNTNPLYTAHELGTSSPTPVPTAIVILENFCHVLERVVADTQVRHVVVTGVGDLLGFPKGGLVNAVVRHVRNARCPPGTSPVPCACGGSWREERLPDLQRVDLTHDDLAFLQYTGGTTGIAKGAMLTHGNMVANVLQARAWFEQVKRPSAPPMSSRCRCTTSSR